VAARIFAGTLRHEAVLERMAPVSDGQGGHAEDWQEVARVFARIEPVSARSVIVADHAEARVTHRVTVRFRDDLKSGMRFLIGERVLAISAVHDPEERGRFLQCLVREVGR
jgi:SPP1 family predicted phage head-tail adaptor